MSVEQEKRPEWVEIHAQNAASANRPCRLEITGGWLLLARVLVGCAAIVLCVGCGDEASRVESHPWPEATDEVVVHSFAFDPHERLAAEGGPGDVSPSQLAVKLESVVKARLTGLGYETHSVRAENFGTLTVLLPASTVAMQDEIQAMLTRPGTLALRLEVRPEERSRRVAESQPVEARRAWSGDLSSFRAFKQKEVDRWIDSDPVTKGYEPSRVGLRLVPRAGRPLTSAEHFAVVEDSDTQLTLDEGAFRAGQLAQALNGRISIPLEVREDYRPVLGGLTEANIGRRMAWIVDGKLLLSPVIRGRISETIVFSPMIWGSSTTPKDDLLQGRMFLSVLRGGPLPVPLRFRSSRLQGPSADEK